MLLEYVNSGSPSRSEATTGPGVLDSDWAAGYPENQIRKIHVGTAIFVETSEGTITVTGQGADVYQAVDEMRFAYKTLTGNGSIAARIDSLTGWGMSA